MIAEHNAPLDVSKQFQLYHQRVNQTLHTFITDESAAHSHLIQAMRYAALSGGKRLRPWLVYTTGQMFGVSLDNLDIPATAVECIHAYSLIHDDLPAMDNDDLRRGQPSCHVKFGEACAILAGDALQTLAFSILAAGPMPDVAIVDRLLMITELAAASGATGMCGGQALDLAAAGSLITLESLEHIHRCKTGALIQSAVSMGALAAGDQGRAVLPLLMHYAAAVGLAFQVQDDILDVTGDSSKTGKRQGADQKMGKNTYPALLGIDGARKKVRELIADTSVILENLAAHSYDTQALWALACFVIERDN